MKLGYFTMPLHPVGRDWRQTLAEDREAVLLAERLGFEEAFIGEHVTDLAETITSCLIFIASLAHETSRIRLGSGTVNLANRHPAATAAEIAMVDTLLEGRFILGVGPGGLRSDAEMMGNFDTDRNAIFLESMEHMIALWTQEPPYRLRGKLWNLTTERTWIPDLGQGAMLKPFQRPHPPIVVTAILPHSNGIAAAAARGWTPISANFVQPWVVATHWLKYVEGCARDGRAAHGADWRVARSIFVADDDATLRRMTRAPGNTFAQYFRNLQRKSAASRGSAVFKHDATLPDEALTDEYLVETMLTSGTVNEVVDKLLAFRQSVGPFGTLLYCGHDWADPVAMRRSMQLMAEEVLPRLNWALGETSLP
ncbi:MAG: LLM class flavin-dependent oxidoreductase [Betaproteobacteria bacterium]|nr:LLM class flavin-dependent oxidoreductase [Betaproteobacteria bacterium]